MVSEAVGLLAPGHLTRAGRGGSGVTGAETAGMSIVESLARFGSRSYRLYVPRMARSAVENELNRLGAPPDRQVLAQSSLANDLSNGVVRTVHAHGSDLHPLAALRSRYASTVIPLSAMQYSISQMHVHWSSFLHYYLCDLYPCDAVLCTTRCARDAQLNIMARIAAALEPVAGVRNTPLRHEVIPYPVDTGYFRPPSAEEKRSARQTLGLPLDDRIILYAGRFDPSSKSDLMPLLLAFRLMLRRIKPVSEACLVLAGYDPSGEATGLKEMADEFGFAEKLHIHTDYAPALQASYYQAADLFVSLSDTLQENFGLTPVEAMACGLPAVVSDWAGYRETVMDGQTGFRARTIWAPEEADLIGLSGFLPWNETHLPLSQGVLVDPSEVAEKLSMLLVQEELRLTMGRAARKHVEAEYAAPVVVQRMEALWKEMESQARSIDKRPPPASSLYETAYGKDLFPYAAEWMAEDVRLVLTEYGRETLTGAVRLPLTKGQEFYYNRDILNHLLGALKAGSLMNRGLPLDEVAAQSARKHGLSVHAARRHLIWLVKHGLATIRT
jgi:glycosyltransferase involved in cell wall biosynthesis